MQFDFEGRLEIDLKSTQSKYNAVYILYFIFFLLTVFMNYKIYVHVYYIYITRHVHVQEDGKEKSEGAYRYKNGWKFPSRVRRGEVGV